MVDWEYLEFLFIDSLEIKGTRFKREILINPAVRLMRELIPGVEKNLINFVKKKRVVEVSGHIASLSFVQSKLLWDIDFELEIMGHKMKIRFSLLFPFLKLCLRIMDEIKSRIAVHNHLTSGNIYGLIETLVDTILPYKIYYWVFDAKTNQNIRLSKFIIQKIASEKKLPSTLLFEILMSKPKIVNKEFQMVGIEHDLLLTYIFSREFLPFQMIEYASDKIYRQIINTLNDSTSRYEIFFFEKIEQLNKILNNIILLTQTENGK